MEIVLCEHDVFSHFFDKQERTSSCLSDFLVPRKISKTYPWNGKVVDTEAIFDANQWTGLYKIGTSVVKELRSCHTFMMEIFYENS